MVIGIGGARRAGKTTLAERLKQYFQQEGKPTTILHQDEFVFPIEQIPRINDLVDWECPASIDFRKLRQAIEERLGRFRVVLVEGLLAFADPAVDELYDKKIFLDIDEATFRERKASDRRWGMEPTWYVDHIWNSYCKYGRPAVEGHDWLVLNAAVPIDLAEVIRFLR